MEFIVAGHGDESSPGRPEGVENLRGCISPNLCNTTTVFEKGPFTECERDTVRSECISLRVCTSHQAKFHVKGHTISAILYLK